MPLMYLLCCVLIRRQRQSLQCARVVMVTKVCLHRCEAACRAVKALRGPVSRRADPRVLPAAQMT